MRLAVLRALPRAPVTKTVNLARGFARSIKKPEKLIDMDKIRINEKSMIYENELHSDRDFFYQEMLNLPSEEEMLEFYQSRKNKFDGVGIKLLIETLCKNRSKSGKLPKQKVRYLFYNEEAQESFKVVKDLLDTRAADLAALPNSLLLEVVELVSKHSIHSENFEREIFSKFAQKEELVPDQFIYELLLKNMDQTLPAYHKILLMLERDLIMKRMTLDDLGTNISLLKQLLSSKYDEMRLLRVLEHHLQQNIKKGLTLQDCIEIFKTYSDNGCQSPNLDLLDKLAVYVGSNIKRLGEERVHLLLKCMANLNYSEYNLMSAVNRMIFDTLQERLIKQEPLAIEEKDEDDEDDPPFDASVDDYERNRKANREKEDEESLEAITRSIFGDMSNFGVDREEYQTQEIEEGDKVKPLNFAGHKAPEILYSLLKLNGANKDTFKLVMLTSLQNIDKLSPKELFYITYSHSKHCFDMQIELEKNSHLYFKRAQKNLLKLNDEFYAMVFPKIQQCLEHFENKDLVSVLYSTTKPGLKKRELKRQCFDLCLDSMRLISQAVQSIDEVIQKGIPTDDPTYSQSELHELRSNYYDIYKIAKGCILKPEMEDRLVEQLVQDNLDLLQIDQEFSHKKLGYKESQIA